MELTNLHPLTASWHWSVSGLSIAAVMLTLIWFGKSFGLSSTYRILCALLGAGKITSYFRFDWKSQTWNLYFAGGIIIGGFLASHVLSSAQTVTINADTQAYLFKLGMIGKTGTGQEFALLPAPLFHPESSELLRALLIIIVGGFLSGFGARYAGGCTSGHFISGLSNLQVPSFITVVFFILGGVISTNYLLPFLLNYL